MDHLHVNAAPAVSDFLMVVGPVGAANLVAKKDEGHPAADAWLDLFGSGCKY